MKTWRSQLIVCLSLGAALNVLIAWTCSLPGIPAMSRPMTPRQIRASMAEQQVMDWNSSVHGSRHDSLGRSIEVMTAMPSMVITRHRAGWPCDSMIGDWGTGQVYADMYRKLRIETKSDGVWMLREPNVLPAGGAFGAIPRVSVTDGLAIPLQPAWMNFVINTLFYAAILWLLFMEPAIVRRSRRIQSHRCPACGYRIAQGTGPVCSECGASLPRTLLTARQS